MMPCNYELLVYADVIINCDDIFGQIINCGGLVTLKLYNNYSFFKQFLGFYAISSGPYLSKDSS